jgi:SNF2 family DNA or RNA helicase
MLTDYHSKYFAAELTKRCPSDSAEKLAGAFVDAQVDLNPHQVEAALFAFRTPLSMGALLADEVGLGKTIEAGLVLRGNGRKENEKYLQSLHRISGNNGIRNFRKNSFFRVRFLNPVHIKCR